MISKLEELLELMVQREASDLHLAVGSPPKIRTDEVLVDSSYEELTNEKLEDLVFEVVPSHLADKFKREKELDFSFGVEKLGRFRVNLFLQQDNVGAAIRALPKEVGSFADLGLPEKTMQSFINKPKGLVLVTGATGSGKSTTLASMVNNINKLRRCHIMTIEDPVEYVFENEKALINQREVGRDTDSFTSALKYVLRQDPDVILIGELRDLESIRQALNIAETGHLVLSTLHTSDVVQTVNRIIDVFPNYQQQQVRVQLSFVLAGIIGQELIPKADTNGRVLATEVLISNPAIRSMIRDKKEHQISSVIQTAQKEGMHTMNHSLCNLYKQGLITHADAISRSIDPKSLEQMIKSTL